MRWNLLGLIFLLEGATALAAEPPDRRRDQFAGEYSYYVYPIAGDIPGLGRAAGIGGSVLNIGGSDTDFTGFKIDGDFEASGYTLLDLHAIKERLIFDVGYYDFDVTSTQYGRGIDSDKNDYILPRSQGSYVLGQMTLSYNQRRYELFVRALDGNARLLEVRDREGVPYAALDSSRQEAELFTVGGSLDLTDDRLDPRRGVRMEFALKLPPDSHELVSEYYIADLNLTGYLPVRRGHDSLVFNYFQSDAYVTKRGETDYTTLQNEIGLGCPYLSNQAERDACLNIERLYLNDLIASNRYGRATALGGTQRLRSYDNGRFYAGHAVSYGVEYRWNITDEYTPFDIFVAKGVRTGIQLAAFAERGSVADSTSDLWDDYRSSYGVGLRIILSGVVIRGDWATGSEGDNFQLFITYPWSMFSVDNPT